MMENRQLAIATGAAGRVGRATALGLLEAGIDVAAVGREPARLGGLETAASGGNIRGAMRTITAGLVDPASFAANVLGQSGRIDIVVDNAGIVQGSIRAAQRRNPLRVWEITPASNGAALSWSARRFC